MFGVRLADRWILGGEEPIIPKDRNCFEGFETAPAPAPKVDLEVGVKSVQSATKGILVGLNFLAVAVGGTPAARAQMSMSGGGRSLGGYGAATIGQYYSSGMGTYMPYNGNASGFVPYRGGYTGGLGVQTISRRLPQTPIGGVSMPMTSIGGASLRGGMAAGTRDGMGMGAVAGRRAFAPFGYEGSVWMGGMVGTPMTRQAGMMRKPSGPGFSYPFQMPTLEIEPGMSIMAMP
jgi:hypothetical protein